jgi:SepF-like predicted cell division protein (DUF552 family)
MHDTHQLLKLADTYYQGCQELAKLAFIKKLPNGKWRVLSQKGKSLGTYDTKDEAVTRLRQVEYFKQHDQSKADDLAAQDNAIDLTEVDDFSYSAVMRKMRQKASKEQVREFLKLFKSYFDKAVKNKLQKPEKIALQNSLVRFSKIHPVKLNKKLVKNASVHELGDPSEVGQYLANIVRFTLNRLDPEKRNKAIENLRNKFYYINADELALKVSPPTAGMGQAITFVKHVLFNQSPSYIREVLNNVSRNLY